MLTAEQQNELRAAVGMPIQSPAVDYAVPATPKAPQDSTLDKMFSDAGVDTQVADAQIAAEQAKAHKDKITALHEQADKLDRQLMIGQAQSAALDVAQGVSIGFRDIARNTYNGIVSLANSVEDYAASKGIGSGDVITEANKWQDQYGQEVAKSNNTTANVARAVTNFSAPLIATMASGGGFLVGSGINAAYNFLAVDPKQARLSDHLKDTGLHEVPLVSDALDYLKTKPSDTELEARFKNLLEGAGLDAAIGGMLWGASRAYTGIKNLRNPIMVEKASQEVGQMTTAAEQAKNAPANIGTPAEQAGVTAAEQKMAGNVVPINNEMTVKLDAIDQSIAQAEKIPDPALRESTLNNLNKIKENLQAKLPPPPAAVDGVPQVKPPEAAPAPAPQIDSPEQMDLFEKQWASMELDKPAVYAAADTGEVRISLTNDQILDRFYELSKTVDQDVLRTPMSDAQLKEAAGIMKNDSGVVDRLATWTPDKGVINDKETLVLKYIMNQGDASMRDAVTKVAANLNDDASLLKFGRELENYSRLLDIRQGAASAKGATLRAEKVIGALANAGDKEALGMLGAQGRAKLAQGLIDQYGGRENLKQMATNMQFIKELADLSKIPDKDFAMRMGQVALMSKWDKLENAITKVALNGMLSSPGTPIKALITNAATSTKTAVDNYIAVGIGKVLGSNDAMMIQEANAHLNGMMSGYLAGVEPAMDTLKKGTITKTARFDVAESAGHILDQEDAMFNAGGAWAANTGAVADKVITTPTRVLMSVDRYWQKVNYDGVVNSEAVRSAMKNGLEGKAMQDYIEAFVANPPANVIYKADQIATTNTMAKGLTGFAESIDNVIQNAPIPFNRVILPFMKTNMNLVEYTAKNSPLAPLLSADFRAALAQGGRARDEALAKVISGSAALAGLVTLAHNGMVVGRNTDNPEIEQAMGDNKTVAPETSVKVGDTWVSLKGLEPLSSLVDMAHMMSKAAGHVSEAQYQDTATAIAIMVSEVATPEQLTDSLSGLLGVMSGKRGAKEYLATIPTRFTPMGGAMTDVRQTVDPTIRSVKFNDFMSTVKARFQNQVPWLSKDLPASRNMWGEKLLIPDGIGPDAISPMATTSNDGMALKKALTNMDDYYELNKDTTAGLYKFDVRMPSKILKNPFVAMQYEMTPQEYSAYLTYRSGVDASTGKQIMPMKVKDAVTSVVKKYDGFNKKPQDYDPKTYARMVGELSLVFKQYTSLADKMILQFGDVGPNMKAQAEKYRSFEELKNVP